MDKYHFNVPGNVIWITHIVSGLLLIYVGYTNLSCECTCVNKKVSLTLIVMGAVACLYHAHLLYNNYTKKDVPDEHYSEYY